MRGAWGGVGMGVRALALLAAAALARPAGADPLRLGVALDAGLPAGAVVSAVVRPWRPLALDAGLAYDLAGLGVRAGATFVPLRAAVAPTLRVEVGHAFAADAGAAVARFTDLTPSTRALLAQVGYDWLALEGGFEAGAPDGLAFFARAGVVFFRGQAGDLSRAARAGGVDLQASGPASFQGTAACATVGVRLFL